MKQRAEEPRAEPDATELRRRLARIRQRIAEGEPAAAFAELNALVSPESDFIIQAQAAKTVRPIPAGALGLRPIRVALLASSTVDHLADVLQYWLAREGFAAEFWIAPFDTVVSTILDQGSGLYVFRPDVVWLFTTWRDARIDVEGKAETPVDDTVREQVRLWQTLQSRLPCAIVQNNADVPEVDPLGNFAGQLPGSQRNCLRLFNLKLAEAAPSGVTVLDLDHLSACFGKQRWNERRYWYHSKHAFSFDAVGLVAFRFSRLLSALQGRARKCLVLDLDNTLWGGVIGDDGLAGIQLGNGVQGEAFTDFQRYVRSLKERGVILAVCSKNDAETAQEPFLSHPASQLKLADIAVFRADWNNKVDGIRNIATTLNIGLDSLVFVDDNPVERNLVRQFLPMVAVPEMPDDPASFIEALDRHRYFETAAFSPEDRERTRYYRENAQRTELSAQFTDMGAYLRSLSMIATVGGVDAFHLPRMAQLVTKSNQFHLTGTRYGEAELLDWSTQPGGVVRHFGLRDRFGDNGLVSVVVLDCRDGEAAIETWVMSCRVLGRTLEEFILNELVALARAQGCRTLLGRYRASAKNKLVADLYPRLGFSSRGAVGGAMVWSLDLAQASPLSTHIQTAPPP